MRGFLLIKFRSENDFVEYSGMSATKFKDTIGAVGMGRVGERTKEKVNPFKNTLIYSAILLNITLTVEKGAVFPCKRVMEGKIRRLTGRY